MSAADRATTFRRLASDTATAEHFTRPGHIYPLIARDGGVLERQGHTEAAVELCQMSGLKPAVGLIGELVNEDGSMQRLDNCVAFAREHALKVSHQLRTSFAIETICLHQALIGLDGSDYKSGCSAGH